MLAQQALLVQYLCVTVVTFAYNFDDVEVMIPASIDLGSQTLILEPCTNSTIPGQYSSQQWSYSQQKKVIANLIPSGTAFCVDIAHPGKPPVSEVYAFPCTYASNEQWVFAGGSPLAGKLQSVEFPDLCLGLDMQETAVVNCSSAPSWTYAPTTKLLSTQGDLCLAVSNHSSNGVPICTDGNFMSLPFCNRSLSPQKRAKDFVSRVLVDEFPALISKNPTVPRLGLTNQAKFGEALHGVLCGCGKSGINNPGSTGCPTSFPTGIAIGSSFNATLFRAIGATIGTEALGLSHQGLSAVNLWTPDINLVRDPRWGRASEVPGEDPTLMSTYVTNFVAGLQGTPYTPPASFAPNTREGENISGYYTRLVATPKHFFAYSLENSRAPNGTMVSRHNFDANVSSKDLAEYYLVPWQAAVEQGGCLSIMCSENAVNGVPACAHADMINTLLRSQWGFDGFVVSDCSSINDFCTATKRGWVGHGYDPDFAHAVRDGLRGGCDMNCGQVYGSSAVDSLNQKLINISDLVLAAERIMTQQFRLGIFDPPSLFPWSNLGANDVDTPSSRQLALEAAQQGIVLLRNKNKVLPLSMPSSSQKLLLLGPFLNASTEMLASYHGDNRQVAYNTPLLALQRSVGSSNTQYVSYPGSFANNFTAGRYSDAIAAAGSKAVGAVVVFVGQDVTIEHEMHDRAKTLMPGTQEAFVKAVLAVRPDAVIVLFNGGTISSDWIASNAPTVLEAFYPGQMGGPAIASVLLGAWFARRLYSWWDITMFPTRDYSVVFSFSTRGGILNRFFLVTCIAYPIERAIPLHTRLSTPTISLFFRGTIGNMANLAMSSTGTYNPSGRMPISVYPEAFNARSIFNMDLEDDGGLTYRYYDGKYGPLPWEFGKGLSYSTFHFTDEVNIRGSLKVQAPQTAPRSSTVSIDAHRLFAATSTSVLTVNTDETATMHKRRAAWAPLSAPETGNMHLTESSDAHALSIIANITNHGIVL